MNNLDAALIKNTKRSRMVFARDRRLDVRHDPYTPDELALMFEPYLAEHEHDGLSPREVRLIETILMVWYPAKRTEKP